MQYVFVENIHERIKSELLRLNISMAEASRQIGEADSQGLRDVCAGRKRASAELIAKLMLIEGLDIRHILTGRDTNEDKLEGEKLRVSTGYTLTREEQVILANYRAASNSNKKIMSEIFNVFNRQDN